MIAALLFDFDGVIGDTMQWHIAAWVQVCARLNIDVVAEDIYLNEGRPAREIAMYICARAGRTLPGKEIEALVDRKNALFRSLNGAKPATGAPELLAELKARNVKTALVTGTVRENIAAVLGTDLSAQFDAIVSADDAKRGKPFPDPYILAAEMVNVPPAQCIVVENAPLGVEAAKAAAMKCVALTTTLPREYLHKADYILSDLSELLARLDELCALPS